MCTALLDLRAPPPPLVSAGSQFCHRSSPRCYAAEGAATATQDAASATALQITCSPTHAMGWRRNQRVWVRLLIHGEARILCEVVDMYGEPESMSGHELYSLMVQMYWQLK